MAAAIFVVAGSSVGQQGPVASLVSTAGWAAAAQRELGQAWICTPGGLVAPAEAQQAGSDPSLRGPAVPPLRRRLPAPLKTAIKDVRSWWRGRQFTIDPQGPWDPAEIRFVWQRHELFQEAGLRLATTLGRPSVLFVPATVVWEADRWGSSRPGWGRWIERFGERPSLRAADLVACGSDVVAEQVQRLGVSPSRILVTPSGVDVARFADRHDRDDVRRRLGMEDDFVLGWVGSFRRFHALEQLVEAAVGMPGATLLLVGDGPERARIERLARERGVRATFTGTVRHDELPSLLGAMDAAVVLASTGEPFHYSPLKLGEYLAAGLPVVGPRIGQLAERLSDGTDALLVPPGDTAALAAAVGRLRAEPGLRRRLAEGARTAALRDWSWDLQVRRVLDAIRS